MADHAANVALDRRGDWEWLNQVALQEALADNANLRLCVDGARRGNGESSAGIALLAYFSDGRQELLHRSGKILGELHSAFAAEMLALDWGLQVLMRFSDM